MYQEKIDESVPGGVAEAIQGGPVQGVATVAVIDINVLFFEREIVFRRKLAQFGQLTLDCLLLLLLVVADARVNTDSHRRTSIESKLRSGQLRSRVHSMPSSENKDPREKSPSRTEARRRRTW